MLDSWQLLNVCQELLRRYALQLLVRECLLADVVATIEAVTLQCVEVLLLRCLSICTLLLGIALNLAENRLVAFEVRQILLNQRHSLLHILGKTIYCEVGLVGIYNDVERFIEEIKRDDKRIALGFTEIDKLIGGGLPCRGKNLSVVSAPTNMGKSIFLANVAVNAAKQGKNVLVITLEMSEIVYAQRIYADMYNLPINNIPNLTLELEKMVKEKQYGNMKIKEFPPSSLTVRALDGYIEQLERQGNKFDLICIDYLTLMLAPNADNSNEAGKSVAREMRALTYKYKCPIFTAAQMNREGMSNTPDMKYFAESIAICAEADFIVSLYRQEEDLAMGIMRAAILKSRLGPKGMTIPLRFNIENLRFENIDNVAAQEIVEGSPAEAISGMNLMFDEA